ncbi:hypothetical protein [Tenacibaculum ovolyticum]|uniref:hypothetical protein n=1 Tax=Tenacibaculum ovolyticum TaxID=104270 RepID=UPI00048F34C4|nr:hypothetical protein [Tenacibaculum ovolyticum]
MIRNVLNKYREFSDSLLVNILYNYNIDNSKSYIELTLSCINVENNFSYEKVKLIMKEIEEFILIEPYNADNKMVIKDALLKEENGLIIFDFDPIDHFDYLEENPNSTFKIKSKQIKIPVHTL